MWYVAGSASGLVDRDALADLLVGSDPGRPRDAPRRIAGGTILAFAMTAPLFNPLSLLYGLTLSEPFVIISFAFCTLLVVTAVGVAWGWLFPGVLHDEPAPARSPMG